MREILPSVMILSLLASRMPVTLQGQFHPLKWMDFPQVLTGAPTGVPPGTPRSGPTGVPRGAPTSGSTFFAWQLSLIPLPCQVFDNV